MAINKDEWSLLKKFVYRITLLVVSLKPIIDVNITHPMDWFYVQESSGWMQYKIISFSIVTLPRKENQIWMISITLWLIDFTYTSVFLSSLCSAFTTTLSKYKS